MIQSTPNIQFIKTLLTQQTLLHSNYHEFIGQFATLLLFTYNLDLGKHLQLLFPGQHQS